MNRNMHRPMMAIPLAAAALLGACSSNDDAIGIAGFSCTAPAPAGFAATAFALKTNNQLVVFNPVTLVAGATVTITGLLAGEQVVGIDFRPSDGFLVAVAKNGTAGNIYTVNTTTGLATLLTGATPLTLAGTNFGVDFNPAANRLRIVSDAEQNLRLNLTVSPYTITADTALAPAGNVVAAAYTNNFQNAPATTLYVIDSAGNLLRQGGVDGTPSPNGGALATVGSLGTGALSGEAGFDIDGVTGVGIAALSRLGASTSQLVRVDLSTAATTCSGTIPGGVIRDVALPTPQAAVAYGVTTVNQLVTFAPTLAGATAAVAGPTITGLVGGDNVVGLDTRPADGALMALGSGSNLYTVNPLTGVATQVGGMFGTLLNGSAFGFDFNPAVDRIRVVSDSDQSLRLHPVTGAVAGTDTTLTAGDVSAAAYTNNFAGSVFTTLFVIDTTANNLQIVGSIGGVPNSPNGGVLTPVGPLGIDPVDTNTGFDIVGGRGIDAAGDSFGDAAAFAALTIGATSGLYSINLETGAATLIGATPLALRALTVQVNR